MARIVLKECFVEINGVDLSDHCESIEISIEKDEVEATTFATGGGTEQMHGLKQDSFQVTLHTDYAVGSVNATLQPLLDGELEFPVVIRPNASASVSATNPNYTADCKLFSLPALSGSPGDLAKVQVDLKPQRTGIAIETS